MKYICILVFFVLQTVVKTIAQTTNPAPYCGVAFDLNEESGSPIETNHYIKFVRINNQTNESDASIVNRYIYYNNISTMEAAREQENELELIFSFQETDTYERGSIVVFIDYDNDGTFESNENIFATSVDVVASEDSINTSFSIPSNVISGVYRLRAMLIFDSAAEQNPTIYPCGFSDDDLDHGEVEDYDITITGPTTANLTVSTNQTICIGSSKTLTANGAGTYEWRPNIGLNNTTGASVNANPTSTTTYTIIGIAQTNQDTATVTITIFDNIPIINVFGNLTICSGTSTVLTASGAQTYTWSPTTGLNKSTGDIVTATLNTTTRTYSITGTNNGICSSTSIVHITVDPCVGVEKMSDSKKISIYPIPVGNELYINYHFPINKIVLQDMAGKIVLTSNSSNLIDKNTIKINTPELNTGPYLITVIDSKNNSLQKLITIIKN